MKKFLFLFFVLFSLLVFVGCSQANEIENDVASDPVPETQVVDPPQEVLDLKDDAEDFLSLIYYNGKLYSEAFSEKFIGWHFQSYESLGQINTVLDKSEIPSNDFETNDSRLEGLTVMLFINEAVPDGLCVKYQDELLVYTPYDSERAERRSTILASEENFSSFILDSYIADGYVAVTLEEYENLYSLGLVSLAEIPEGYKNINYVLVRQNPGIPESQIICQIFYNFDQQEMILIQQESVDTYREETRFEYSSQDLSGRAIKDTHPWASFRANYVTSEHDMNVFLTFYSTQDVSEEYCRNVLCLAN